MGKNGKKIEQTTIYYREPTTEELAIAAIIVIENGRRLYGDAITKMRLDRLKDDLAAYRHADGISKTRQEIYIRTAYNIPANLLAEVMQNAATTTTFPDGLGYKLNEEATRRIVEMGNKFIFDTPIDYITFLAAMNGDATIKVKEIQPIAMLLDRLAAKDYIYHNWQTIAAELKIFESKNGVPISASGYKTALNASRGTHRENKQKTLNEVALFLKSI